MTKNKYLLYILLPALVLLAYSKLFFIPQAVDPDAQMILPNIEKFPDLFSYLKALFTLRTVDFQPVRDLTFKLDMFFFHLFKINTFIFQNCLWWIASCFVMFKIIRAVHNKLEDWFLFIIVIMFSLNPLFSFIVSWGMARKHVLALFFVLLATYNLIKTDQRSFKSGLKISLFYFLSLLSQPIHILWPFWAFIYLRLKEKLSYKSSAVYLSSSLFFFIIGTAANFLYYNYSYIFKFYYPSKTAQTFNIADKLLAFGHYHYQLFFPYQLSFTYQLGDATVLAGLSFLVLLMMFIYKAKERIEMALWVLAGYASLVVILNTPRQLYDSYLLYPAFCFLMVFLKIIPKDINKKVSVGICAIITLIWGSLTFINTDHWKSSLELAKISFQNRPACVNAINYLRSSYEAYQSAPRDARSFIEENQCLEKQNFTAYSAVTNLILTSYIMFHEEDFPLEDRLSTLDRLGMKNVIMKLTLAALYIKNNRFKEADAVIEKLIEFEKIQRIKQEQFHPITAYNVHPYCVKRKWKECIEVTEKLSSKPQTPYQI